MYKIEVKHAEKQVIITMAGALDANESDAYLKEFESYIHKNDFSDYYLIVDTSELKISSHELEGNMKKAMELNFTTPFKARFNIAPKSAVTNLQANRVGKELDLKNQMMIVRSFEEIVPQLK